MDFTFNIAKGRTVELWRRAKVGDPADAGLVVVLLAAAGLEPDAGLVDRLSLASVLTASTEAANTGYTRKVLAGAALPAFPAPDLAMNTYFLPMPNLTWLSVQPDVTGSIGKLIVAYDPDTTAGTDGDIIPLTAHDFTVLPAGDNIVTAFDAAGFYRAGTCE